MPLRGLLIGPGIARLPVCLGNTTYVRIHQQRPSSISSEGGPQAIEAQAADGPGAPGVGEDGPHGGPSEGRGPERAGAGVADAGPAPTPSAPSADAPLLPEAAAESWWWWCTGPQAPLGAPGTGPCVADVAESSCDSGSPPTHPCGLFLLFLACRLTLPARTRGVPSAV